MTDRNISGRACDCYLKRVGKQNLKPRLTPGHLLAKFQKVKIKGKKIILLEQRKTKSDYLTKYEGFEDSAIFSK